MSGPVDKDPITGRAYTVSEPRLITASVTDTGKFIWPQVATAKGEPIKLLYKLWTEQEKQIYKDYRKAAKVKQLEREVKPELFVKKPVQHAVTKAPIDNYCYWGAASATTQNVIKKCNAYAGTWNCGGIVYAILTVRGTGTFYHIPRSVITSDDLNRICAGNSCN